MNIAEMGKALTAGLTAAYGVWQVVNGHGTVEHTTVTTAVTGLVVFGFTWLVPNAKTADEQRVIELGEQVIAGFWRKAEPGSPATLVTTTPTLVPVEVSGHGSDLSDPVA